MTITKNVDHLIDAIQNNYRTIKVKYESNGATYTFKVSNDIEVEVGDFVLVQSANNQYYRTVEVVSIDNEIDINFEADFKYKWVVSNVDFTKYNKQIDNEKILVSKIEDLRRRQQRQLVLQESGLTAVDLSNLQQLGEY